VMYSEWLIAVLKYVPFIKVHESRPFTLAEISNMYNRILTEKEVQWHFNHPNEPFLKLTEKELGKELRRRMFDCEY
jgi:hypothetical protein